jgi:hypothetical protein
MPGKGTHRAAGDPKRPISGKTKGEAMIDRSQPLGGGVGAGDGSSGGNIPLPPQTDQEVIAAVRIAFFLDPDLPEDLGEVDSVEHTVYLRGVAPTPFLKQRAEQVAAQVLGVNRVINELRVARPNADEEL